MLRTDEETEVQKGQAKIKSPNNPSLGCVVPPGSSRAFGEQMPGRERSRDLPRVGQCEWLAGLARSPTPFLVGDPDWVTLGGAAVQIHTAPPWAVWPQKQDDFAPPATSKRVHRHESVLASS